MGGTPGAVTGASWMRCSWLGGLAILLAGCSFYPKLVIFNHTGQDLIVHVDDSHRGLDDRPVVIKNGAARKLLIGAVLRAGNRFTISQQGCRYTYQEPEDDAAYWDHYSDVYFVLQVEPDYRIHIRPPGKAPIPSVQLPKLQTPGFPLEPLAKRCG